MPALPAITIRLHDEPVRSETLAVLAAAPNVVVITTTLADQAVTVTSSYLGHDDVRTHVIHLILTPERRYVSQTQMAHDELPVTHARERCLLEHATVLQDVTGGHVNIGDAALQAAAEL